MLAAKDSHSPVSARQGTSVPIKLLHSSQSGSYTAAFTFRCTSSADHTSTSSQHLRSAGICFQTVVEDSSFLCLSARLAH